MLEYPNIKSGDTMSKNKEILNNWKNELEKRNTLNLEQAQSLYKEIIECKDESLKRQLRHKLINETSYVVFNCIKSTGYEYFNSYSLDMNDIINAALEEWIRILDSEEILNVNSFKDLIEHSFDMKIAKNLGIKIDMNNINTSKTSMHDLKYFLMYLRQEHLRKDINEILDENIEEEYDKKELKETVEEALEQIMPDDKKRLIVTKRLGLNEEEPKVLRAIAQELGVSKDCVADNEKRFLRKIRHPYYLNRLKEFY